MCSQPAFWAVLSGVCSFLLLLVCGGEGQHKGHSDLETGGWDRLKTSLVTPLSAWLVLACVAT